MATSFMTQWARGLRLALRGRTQFSTQSLRRGTRWHLASVAAADSSRPALWLQRCRASSVASPAAAAAIANFNCGADANADGESLTTNGTALAAATLLSLGAMAASAGSNNDYNAAVRCEAAGPDSNLEPEPPEYGAEEVASNDGKDGSPIWMSYGGTVYDVTSFVANHPGGDRLLLAAGGPIEPHWHLYRQHFASDLPMRLLEPLAIGTLRESDQDAVDARMEKIYEEEEDPYGHEPERRGVVTDNEFARDGMKVHSDQPMNAEVPEHLLTRTYLTPSYLYYLRHHHPVPYLSKEQVESYRLEIDLTEYDGRGKIRLSLDDLKSMPKEEIVMTMQCSGNRRSGYNVFEKTSGTTWGQGAISTAKWGGVRLSELLKNAGMGDPVEAREKGGVEHVRFAAIDGMKVSIGIEKATNPYGDVMVCYEMNDEPIPRDHGYPLRLVVPGYAGVRSLKWMNRIALSKEEAEGPWQRGLNYKVLPPSVHDANEVDVNEMPACNELSVTSGITNLEPVDDGSYGPGDVVTIRCTGWAFAGGGRNIVRVDVTGDVANHRWMSADLKEGADQRHGRGWAWTFWEADVPAKVQADGSVHIYCKGVDMAFNSQPESAEDQWNVRGLMNNSWYHRTILFNTR